MQKNNGFQNKLINVLIFNNSLRNDLNTIVKILKGGNWLAN